MTPVSPPASSTTASNGSSRPPARNKSSSSLSTHTLKSLSSTGSGKPRRNKSSASLHHAGGHHHVTFNHHRWDHAKKHGHGHSSTSGAGASSSGTVSHGMKRKGSQTGSTFGLGMTSMTRSDSQDAASNKVEPDSTVPVAAGENASGRENEEQRERPNMGPRRTSSSSSTATIVHGSKARGARRQNSGDVRRGERSRSRTNSRVKLADAAKEAERDPPRAGESHDADASKKAKKDSKGGVVGSVASNASGWESATDSPLHIGRKLPDVERDFKPEGASALALALEGGDSTGQQDGTRSTSKPSSRNLTPSRQNGGKKPKFQFADDEDEDEDIEEAERLRQGRPVDRKPSTPPEIPDAAMPPAETPALPALPAMLQAITPARSPELDETRAPPPPQPEQLQETAALQAPAAPSAPQGISPSNGDEFGQPPPVAGPELSRSPSPMTDSPKVSRTDSQPRPQEEPSLAKAANVDEPNMAVTPDKRHQQRHQGLKSLPRPSPTKPVAPPSPSTSSNKVKPEDETVSPSRRGPAEPNPTSLQRASSSSPGRKGADAEPPRQLARPVRAQPTRKSSNASVLSMASGRSAAPSLISRMAAPSSHFRRSTSGIAPMVDRNMTVRGEMSTPSPEPQDDRRGHDRYRSDAGVGTSSAARRENGIAGTSRSNSQGHQRTSSQNSQRSHDVGGAGGNDSDPSISTRRSNTYAAGEVRKPRISVPSPGGAVGGGGSGALAALGQIAQAAAARTPSTSSPGGATDGSRTPGALTNAKRSASGYFSSALRGLTSLPSALTPPLSPSAGSSSLGSSGAGAGQGGGRHPIPGAAAGQSGYGPGTSGGGSYTRSGMRSRSSPSPQQPPLIVKFLEQPTIPLVPPPRPHDPAQSSTSPRPPTMSRSSGLSQSHRNASSASLAMSRTQQKALLARDAPYGAGAGSSPASPGSSISTSAIPTMTSVANGAASSLGPPPSPVPASPGHPYLASAAQAHASHPASAGGGASPTANANGMQKWAFGLIKEAERIERQWRCVEKWRDPVGESLERVLHGHKTLQRLRDGGDDGPSGRTSRLSSRGMDRDASGQGVSSAGEGQAKLGRMPHGRAMTVQ
ncbi:hypothetical protein JCM10212_006115 [Sporobolomyces blumeae]